MQHAPLLSTDLAMTSLTLIFHLPVWAADTALSIKQEELGQLKKDFLPFWVSGVSYVISFYDGFDENCVVFDKSGTSTFHF